MMENEHGRIDLLTQKQIDWCNEQCNFEWLVKDDGKVYSKNDNIEFKNKNSIVSFPVKFGDCKNFYCFYCDLLKSLEGSSENVSGDFNCTGCDSLKSLKGGSLNVNGNFNCSFCHSLESLKGAPENVGESFGCSYCKSLVSLEGVPKSVGKSFYCSYCDSLKFIDGLKNMKIKGKIYYHDCPKLEKYDFILSVMKMFRRWQKSEYTVDEFTKEWNGYLEAKKYGI